MPLSIGQLAKATNVSVDTIRYYERRGILPTAERRRSGYRAFSSETVDRINLVKRLQAVGFRLEDVRDALQPLDAGTATIDGESWRVDVVLSRLDAKLAEIARMRAELVSAFALCGAGSCELVR